MIRKYDKPDLILTADWHLRDDQPICRTDNLMQTQSKKIGHITKLQLKHGLCPVIHAGDVLNHWKASPNLLTFAIETLPEEFYTVYGNHDLPQHSVELSYKSGVVTLEAAQKITNLFECHWEQKPENASLTVKGRKVLVWHTTTWKDELPWPGCSAPTAKALLKKYPRFDLIVTGHNHETFVEEYDGRLLVNPGCLTRQRASEIDHEPCVFLWYAKTNKVVKAPLPFDKDAVTRDHIEAKEENEQRHYAFIRNLSAGKSKRISFEDNMEDVFRENRVAKSIRKIIWGWMDE